MTIQERMPEIRKRLGLSTRVMANRCAVSESLIIIIEGGGVTIPVIAERIGAEYGLSADEIEQLIPENRRAGNPNYDPDKFRDLASDGRYGQLQNRSAKKGASHWK